MRARRSSRSAWGVSPVSGRIVVSPAGFSAITAMWVLLRGRWFVDWTEPARLVSTSHQSEPLGWALGFARRVQIAAHVSRRLGGPRPTEAVLRPKRHHG